MTFNERDCLSLDPFEGGKGDDPYRIIRDRIVTARKGGPCVLCLQDIVPGMRIRARTDLSPEVGMRTFRFCTPCCEAMASARDDAGMSLERRFRLSITGEQPR